jgi:hypothetical protein
MACDPVILQIVRLHKPKYVKCGENVDHKFQVLSTIVLVFQLMWNIFSEGRHLAKLCAINAFQNLTWNGNDANHVTNA